MEDYWIAFSWLTGGVFWVYCLAMNDLLDKPVLSFKPQLFNDPQRILSNPKHELFAQEVIKQKGNITKAYSNIYDEDEVKNAEANSSRLIRVSSINQRVCHLLEKSGRLRIENTLERLADCMEANKAIVHSKDSVITMVPDNQTRLAATETTLKLHGLLKNDIGSTDGVVQNTIVNQNNVEVNVTIERLCELTSKFTSLSRPNGIVSSADEDTAAPTEH